MLKLAGAVLLTAGAAALGFSAAAQLERRVRTLRTILSALELMERELAYRLTPMPELFSILAERLAPPVGSFFKACRERLSQLGEKRLEELWEESLSEFPMDLGAEELQVLRELGGILGQYDGEGQREALALAQGQMKECLNHAAEERTRMGRVYGTLGLAAGAFLVILLL